MSWYNVVQRKARKACALSRSDWGALLEAWSLLLAVDLGLRALPFLRVQRFAGRLRGAPGPEEPEAVLRRLDCVLDIAARNHLHPMGCLRRALVLQRMLGRRGIATELRIGVQREDEALRAHAWLEYAGRPVGELQHIPASYAPLLVGEAGR